MSDLNNENKPERSSSIDGLVWFLLAFPIGGFLVQHKDQANKFFHNAGLIMFAVNLLLMFICIVGHCFSKNEANKKSLRLIIYSLISTFPIILILYFGALG